MPQTCDQPVCYDDTDLGQYRLAARMRTVRALGKLGKVVTAWAKSRQKKLQSPKPNIACDSLRIAGHKLIRL